MENQGQKVSLESLSKEEIINKYKNLLGIAKKAKQTKDETCEENRKLKEQLHLYETQKEADKNSLLTMKEMLEAYTENKLQLTTELAESKKRHKVVFDQMEKLSIENESLKRQLGRLTEDNESLLIDIENMEKQLQQVSGLGKDQKEHLVLLEQEINQLRENETKCHELNTQNEELKNSLDELKEKYAFIKEINGEQRKKFNMLKDRFIDFHKKLKKLKECKRILLETQHEYAESVSQWQMEIIKASKMLCKELNDLKLENTQLLEKLGQMSSRQVAPNQISIETLNSLLQLSEKANNDYNSLQKENLELKQKISLNSSAATASCGLNITREKLDELWQLSKLAFEEYQTIQHNYMKTKNMVNTDSTSNEMVPNVAFKLEELKDIADKAKEEYQLQKQELTKLKEDYELLKNKSENKNTNKKRKQDHSKLQKAEESLQQLQKEYQVLLEKSQSSDATNINSEKLENETKQLSAENVNLHKRIAEMISASEEESNQLIELKKKLVVMDQSAEEYKQRFKQKEREHYELLDEMRELNEALKVRGDLISRQQEDQLSLKSELKTHMENQQKLQQDLNEKDLEINEKQLKLDGITKSLEETKQTVEAAENKMSINEEKIQILNTELQTLKSTQTNMDFDNQSEILSTSTISRADELQRLKEVEDSFEDKYNKLRGLAAKLKKKLQEETILKQKLENELRELKTLDKETQIKLEDLNTKINEMNGLRNQLTDKQKQVDALKTENQKLKSSRKQANVLNLEIEAAEKSLTEVTNKLANRTSDLDAAQESLKIKDSTIMQLRKEIELLEASKTAETKHSQDLKEQIDHLQKTLKDAVHSKQLAFDKTKILEQDVENLKLELESVRVELSDATSNSEQTLTSLKTEKEQTFSQLSATQTALAECELKLRNAERTTDELRIEYLDYKVKAQAVLRKNQNRDSTRERELEEELVALRATETQLKTTIETMSSKLNVLDNEKQIVLEDNTSLQMRSKELMQLVEEMRSQNDSLSQEMQQHIQQQHESLKQHRLQIESMDKYHKEQLASINTNHQRQLEQSRKELLANVRLPPVVGAAKSSTHADAHLLDQTKLDYLLMEREDAEGSEEAETLATLAASRKISNASSSAKRLQHDFMPLDELLNTPMNAINSETLISSPTQITETLNNGSNVLQLELNTTKERLQKQESRVRHMTALLAENEQDLAKLTQMNDMLKEELRRQERSVEREQHMHNSEYIKNVIMKFLTLNNADEKTRLVPVLNTILKLSRPETEMLNCVAKGQKVSESTQKGGWGNFLPWGNGGGGNN